MRILLVEDDRTLAVPIGRELSLDGHHVEMADGPDRGRELATSNEFDAIIVETKPSTNRAVSLCAHLREIGVVTPLMLVAESASTPAKVAGLEAGADDYVTQPVEMEEIIARLRSLLRRGRPRTPAVLQCEDLTMDLDRHVVTRQGQAITLSPKEFALLRYFMANISRVLSRGEISRNVWGEDAASSSNTIDVYVSMLRRKIDKHFDPKLIHTVIGYGYRIGLDTQTSAAAAMTGTMQVNAPAAVHDSSPRHGNMRPNPNVAF
jgi:DNA-binding response OmpR family regulator